MLRGFISLLCILTATSAVGEPGFDSFGVPGAERSARRLPSTDRPAPSVTRPLPFFYDLYTFRDNRNGTRVVAAFAVSAGELEKEVWESDVRYRFDVSLIIADTALRTVSRTDDSVFVRFPRPLGTEHLLYTHVEVQAPPSQTTLHRVIMTDATTPGIGQLHDSIFPIPDYSGSQLMLSDIALGHPEAQSGWQRGDVTLALLPTSQFPSSSFDVYYEIYNLPRGNRYATDIFIEQVDDRRTDRRNNANTVRLRFSGESATRADGSLQELRHVEASLARGSYRITITVKDEESGHTASRSRFFQVRGWDRGATLVAALPQGGSPSRSRDR